MKPLSNGIYYKVLAEGKADGKHPTPRSIVTAHYTGRTIDGKQFDSSRGGAPLVFFALYLPMPYNRNVAILTATI